ncbi:MAG: DsbA family protein [Alphaproteobacteria bacterium]|nr:DsbA family protein [Alphaproteobacteria bacterium]
MSIKSAISSAVTSRLFSEAALARRRASAERARVASGAPHKVEYFHGAADPYAHLVAQVLGEFVSRYDIVLQPWLCSPPPDWAAPDRERLIAYAREDAARLARRAGLEFADPGHQPSADRIAKADAQFAASLERGTFVADAAAIGAALWGGAAFSNSAATAPPAPHYRAGDARRAKLGHYLNAMFYYGGEWYWGLDRLHFLESRLASLGARKSGPAAAAIFPPPNCPSSQAQVRSSSGGAVDFFLSFRSPYTYLAAERVKALAEHHGAELRLRFVLPMVMRGMQVPRSKSFYITSDTAREAWRLGVPFGRICDPVGRPVERGYSVLPWAIARGHGYAYCHAFMRAVWSQGVDAGEQSGLRRIVENAGLPWSEARSLIGNDDWRAEAEVNRQEMFGLGLWGVPSFRCRDVAVWGQDRLWAIEDALAKG